MLGYASATTAKILSYEDQPQLKIFQKSFFWGATFLTHPVHLKHDVHLLTD